MVLPQGNPWIREIARLKHQRNWNRPFMREFLAESAEIPRLRAMLRAARGAHDTCWLEDADCDEPSVTVRIATRNRPEELIEKAIASALRQTYDRLDVLVIGDGCDEDTGLAVRKLNAPNVRYVNLPRQGVYPSAPRQRWHVAGSKPMNVALDLASGDWLAPCDDDDELTDDHVERLLTTAKSRRAEFIWSNSEMIASDGSLQVVGRIPLSLGATTHGAILYSMGLAFIRYSMTCFDRLEPMDWNLWRRMQLAGVTMTYLPEVTYRYWTKGSAQYAAV
jgi:glycosyltransferase involved in cell wall biosynthesis